MTNIVSAVTDPILMKLLEVDSKKKFDFNFLEPDHVTQTTLTLNLLDSKNCWTPNCFDLKFFWTKIF